MPLNLFYIKYFCDAVRLESITEAAKANCVTQSAISQGISKLEKSLGCNLLAKHPNRFRITPSGLKAYEQMVEILQKMIDFEKNFSGHVQFIGDLEFATTFSFATMIVPSYLTTFRSIYPDVRVNFQCSGNLEDIKNMLKTGQIDFGIIPDIGDLDLTGFVTRTLHTGLYGLYVSRKIPISNEKNLSFILPRRNQQLFKLAYSKKYEVKPSIFLEVKSWLVAAYLTIEGLGIGYFPDFVAKRKKKELRPASFDLLLPQYRISAIFPAGMRLRQSSEIFLSYFHNSNI